MSNGFVDPYLDSSLPILSDSEGSEARRRYVSLTFGLNPFRGRYFLFQKRKYPKKTTRLSVCRG
ncbi:MAG TPA: hypothetical protein PLK06_00720, partial [bacterium]|nr:hypothetical protein [bacterium]